MKKIIIIATALAAMAPAAFAYSGMLTDAQKAEVLNYVPNANLSDLTSAQANAIVMALSGGENVGGQIRSILMN